MKAATFMCGAGDARIDAYRGEGRLQLRRPAGFAIASAALALVFLASGTPVPLYNTYRIEDGITDGDLAITTVAYLGVTALSLLMLGCLSNHLGRKPLAVAAVLIGVGGLVVLMNVHALPALMVGRVLQGIACGVASSAVGAWAIDLAPARLAWLPGIVTGTLPPFVLPLGALVSGALTQYAPAPRTLTFAIIAACLLLLAVLLAAAPETVTRGSSALASLRPRVHVPQGQGRLLFAVGLGGFTLGAILVVIALHASVIAPFLAASYVAGIAQGMVAAGGVGALLEHAGADDRAGLLASTYLISYGCAAVPGLISGQLTTVLDLPDIAIGYVALIIIASLAAAFALTRCRPAEAIATGGLDVA